MNPTEVLVRRWAREETIKVIQEQTRAKQDVCGHWVSGTYRKGVLSCDACGIALSNDDAEAGGEKEDLSNIGQRYVEKVL